MLQSSRKEDVDRPLGRKETDTGVEPRSKIEERARARSFGNNDEMRRRPTAFRSGMDRGHNEQT